MSLPLRERGLKYPAGTAVFQYMWSLPLRERGLKSFYSLTKDTKHHVAPLAGAWIEIKNNKHNYKKIYGRSPCGSVD